LAPRLPPNLKIRKLAIEKLLIAASENVSKPLDTVQAQQTKKESAIPKHNVRSLYTFI
jgi:hypothetical protein